MSQNAMDTVQTATKIQTDMRQEVELPKESRSRRPRRTEVQSGSSKKLDEQKQKDLHNIELGRRGEEAAARFLYRHGYEILERNWTCIAGEADIIARDDDYLIFVEVKTRSNCEKGLPSEAVNAEKRKRYERIAGLYLQDHDIDEINVRFDVIAVLVVGSDRAFMRHHIDAFSAA